MSTLLLNSESLTFLALSLSLLFILFLFFFSTSPRSTKTPCPQSHPIIGNLIAFLRNRHRFHDCIAEMLTDTPSSTLQASTFLNLSHGICTANPKNVEHILLTNFPNYIKGSRFQDVLSELLGHGIFNVDDHLWITQRKISSYEFSTKSLRNFIADVVCSQIRTRLLPYLRDTASDTSKNSMAVVDLQQILQEFTFNNICSVAFGVDPSSLKSKDFFNAFDDAVEICTSRILSPLPILWKVKRYLNLGSEKRLKQDLKIIDDYAMEIIKSKEQGGGGEDEESRRDLLSRFMSNSNLEFQDQNEKRKFLRDIVISFVMAGKDSTSTALTWFFWLIAGNPRCESLIRAELAQLAPEGSRSFSYNDLKKLNYLHACLSESMRLFPPVPINSRLTVKDDVLPDGTHVKKGWFADYSAYAMGRSEKVWGRDYMEFKPERWLVGDGDGDDDHRVYQPFDQFRYTVFHCGPRMCLGKEMAYLQMKSIVASLMSEFEITAVDGGATVERMMEPPYTLSFLLKMRGGLPVKIRRRHL